VKIAHLLVALSGSMMNVSLPAATYLAHCQESPLAIGQAVPGDAGDAKYLIDNIFAVQPAPLTFSVGYVYVRHNREGWFNPVPMRRPVFTVNAATMLYVGKLQPDFSVNKVLDKHKLTRTNYTLQRCFSKPWNHQYPSGKLKVI